MFFQPRNSIGKTSHADFPRRSHTSTSSETSEQSASPLKSGHSWIVATNAAGKAVTKVQVQPNTAKPTIQPRYQRNTPVSDLSITASARNVSASSNPKQTRPKLQGLNVCFPYVRPMHTTLNEMPLSKSFYAWSVIRRKW
jgi:hypothetical protein